MALLRRAEEALAALASCRASSEDVADGDAALDRLRRALLRPEAAGSVSDAGTASPTQRTPDAQVTCATKQHFL